MRVTGRYFVIVLEDPDAITTAAVEDIVLARRLYNEWNGKVGLCVQSTFRNGAYWFLLRSVDRFECFNHRQVRVAPSEMQEMEEDLKKLIKFNAEHGTSYMEC